MNNVIAFLQAHEWRSKMIIYLALLVALIGVLMYALSGASDSICNTTILSYPIAS